MNRPLIVLAGLIVAGGTAGGAFIIASPGGEEEVVQQVETATPSPEASVSPLLSPLSTPVPTIPAGATLWRWVNVTVVVPDNSELSVTQDSDPPGTIPPHVGPVLKLSTHDSESGSSSSVVIDAETGAILRQDVRPEHRSEIDAVLNTLTVSPLDISTAKWPYSGELSADYPRETFGGMSFVRPAPDTGLVVGGAISDPGGPGLRITNGRSSGVGVYVDDATGKLAVNTEYLLPEYEAVFMRWVDTVKLCGVEVSC